MGALVPPLTAGECQVWWADAHVLDGPVAGFEAVARDGTGVADATGVGHTGDAAAAAFSLLDARERARWQRLRGEAGRALYLTAHALVRLVLGAHLRVPAAELAFRTDCAHCGDPQHGKPGLAGHANPPEGAAGWEFSLSHTPHRIAVAVALRTPLGVDVERIREPAPATLARALSGPEHATLTARPEDHRAGDFTRYWARKEAALKATGDGLAVRPDRLTVSAPDAPARLLRWTGPRSPDSTVHLADLTPGGGYQACLAVVAEADRVPRVTEHDGTVLLRTCLP